MNQGHKDLVVWQKAMTLTTFVYELLQSYPKEELFGLTSQMKRSAVSIPSNIAEGYGRNTTKDFKHFLSIAYGSALEPDTQFTLGKRLSFGKSVLYTKIEAILEEVLKMLSTMKKSS